MVHLASNWGSTPCSACRGGFKSRKGANGAGSDRTGAGSDDVILKVPVGTQIFGEDKETLLADLDTPGKRVVVAKGGDGGFGNANFKTSTNRSPRRIEYRRHSPGARSR